MTEFTTSRRMRQAGLIARMEERRGIDRVLVGHLKERDNWKTQA